VDRENRGSPESAGLLRSSVAHNYNTTAGDPFVLGGIVRPCRPLRPLLFPWVPTNDSGNSDFGIQNYCAIGAAYHNTLAYAAAPAGGPPQDATPLARLPRGAPASIAISYTSRVG
jgi:hypothetical protein